MSWLFAPVNFALEALMLKDPPAPEHTRVKDPTRPTFFILGPPGSGKTTVCQRLAARYGCAHVDVPELVRREAGAGTQYGTLIADLIKASKPIPHEVTSTVVKQALAGVQAPAVCLDGFPRSPEEATMFEQIASTCTAAVLLECPAATASQRLAEAGTPDPTGEAFRHFAATGGKVAESYRSAGKLHVVDAGAAPDAVFSKVEAHMGSYGLTPKDPVVEWVASLARHPAALDALHSICGHLHHSGGQNPKFHCINSTSPKFEASIATCPAALHLLKHVGYTLDPSQPGLLRLKGYNAALMERVCKHLASAVDQRHK